MLCDSANAGILFLDASVTAESFTMSFALIFIGKGDFFFLI